MGQSSRVSIYFPEFFGLSKRTRLHTLDSGHLAFVVDRKSRFIMKDGKGLIEKAEKVWSTHPGMKISLMTSAPVCSKTLKLLTEHGIDILPL